MYNLGSTHTRASSVDTSVPKLRGVGYREEIKGTGTMGNDVVLRKLRFGNDF
jgi:hypothetical protein